MQSKAQEIEKTQKLVKELKSKEKLLNWNIQRKQKLEEIAASKED